MDHGNGKKWTSGNSEIKEVGSTETQPGTEGWGKQEALCQRVQLSAIR